MCSCDDTTCFENNTNTQKMPNIVLKNTISVLDVTFSDSIVFDVCFPNDPRYVPCKFNS